MIQRTFIARGTGQLSHVEGVSLPGTKLRTIQGHEYRLTIDERTGRGQLEDLTFQAEEALGRGGYAGAQQQ